MKNLLTNIILGVILGLSFLLIYKSLGFELFNGVGFIFGLIGAVLVTAARY